MGRIGIAAALAIALSSCAHRTVLPDETGSTIAHADGAHITLATAEQPHISPPPQSRAAPREQPQSSPVTLSPVDRIAEDLTSGLMRGIAAHASECTDGSASPLRITIVGFKDDDADAIADLVAVRFVQEPGIRVSNRQNIQRVLAALYDEVKRGTFDETTVQPLGKFKGLDALGIVDAHHVGTATVYTLHLTCVRTLLDIGAASSSNAAASSSDAAFDQEAFARVIRQRREQEARRLICRSTPELPACREFRAAPPPR